MELVKVVSIDVSRWIAAVVLACLAIARPGVAFAEAPSAIINRIETQRHLAMIEAGISTTDAQNLSLLGAMTYHHHTCGDHVVRERDIASVWRLVKSIHIDEQIRKAQTAAYVDAMSAALVNITAAEKVEICKKAKEEYDDLKRDWGIK